ncbi:MAG: hypothetical protein A2792_04665 [Sphingomonadales bacterium RIFCSPHIGHO2_01_FULL_65_20]|nr:MAG: hypothetical protein A2792_04665 [Sphingomonadales bacterium RIFCSPHIGHO2_01_FULL_65_20]
MGQPIDAAKTAALFPLAEKLALVRAINEAGLLVAILTVLALCMVQYYPPPSASRFFLIVGSGCFGRTARRASSS